jgi:hypothetical protein
MALLDLRPTVHLAVASILAAAGCVEPYSGSNVQLDFSEGVPLPGGDPELGEAPADSYFTFYAIDHVRDDAGTVVESYLSAIHRFEIRPVIDRASPCFIDLEDARFPGVHVTRFAEKLRADVCDRAGLPASCIDNPLDPPNVSEFDITDVITADVRMRNLADLQQDVKAVVSFSNFTYPAPAGSCGATGNAIPPPACISDADNAQRLRVCRDLWQREADQRTGDDVAFYEGSDKIFTLPLSGKLYGMVEGLNPVNDIGLLGGATLFVDEVLAGYDAYAIHWQFKDLDGDGQPDRPPGFTRAPSDVGYVYMFGVPEVRTRGVINVPLFSPFIPTVAADVAIFPDLAADRLHF